MSSIGDQLGEGLKTFQKRLEQIRLNDRQTKSFLRKELLPVKQTARKLVPKPGYPGDKPQYKPLRDTIMVATRGYRDITWYGAVGPQYPAGAHGHLVEGWREPARHMSHGSHTGGTLKPTPFISVAWTTHSTKILAAVELFVAEQIQKSAQRG